MNADMGNHEFRYALYPHQGTFPDCPIWKESYNFNYPLRVSPSPPPLSYTPPFSFNASFVLLDSVKLAEDQPSPDRVNVILRLAEMSGGREWAQLKFSPFAVPLSVSAVDLLERPVNGVDVKWDGKTHLKVHLLPFKVVSLLVSFPRNN
jgi:alpha-mannosidase